MENVIVHLCNDKSRKKSRKKVKQKPKQKNETSVLNENLQDYLKKLRFNLETLKLDEKEPVHEIVVTPRSRKKRQELRQKNEVLETRA